MFKRAFNSHGLRVHLHPASRRRLLLPPLPFNPAVTSSSYSTHIVPGTALSRPTPCLPEQHTAYTGKGKSRWDAPSFDQQLLTISITRPSPRRPRFDVATAHRLGHIRHFHATSRRDALPLLPALGALLKVWQCPRFLC